MSLCPNLWVIVSTCITKWAQSHSGSLKKSEHGCHRARSTSHIGGSVQFSWQHFIKDKGLCTGIALCTTLSYFFTSRHTREARAMFNLWCSRHEKDLGCTLGKEEWEEGGRCGEEQRVSFIDDESNCVIPPFHRGWMQHVHKICCRVTDHNLPRLVLHSLFWDLGIWRQCQFVTFSF